MLLELEKLEPFMIPLEGLLLLFCILNVVPFCFSFNKTGPDSPLIEIITVVPSQASAFRKYVAGTHQRVRCVKKIF